MKLMADDTLVKLRAGAQTALEDKNWHSDVNFRPQFVFNNSKKHQKILASLERELMYCDEFCFSVAFITMSGLIMLLPIFKDLADRGVKGKILTTNYLNFSEPRALEQLQAFSNIEVKMYWADSNTGFHTKGYIFRQGEVYRAIVGSANLTGSALTCNEEWNTKLVTLKAGEYYDTLITRFYELWNDEKALSYDEFYDDYLIQYQQTKDWQQLKAEISNSGLVAEKGTNEILSETNSQQLKNNYNANLRKKTQLQPNSMQSEFVTNLQALVASGAKRALLISATGTGKTYASAFAIRKLAPRKMLFLVHREQIAKQALNSYRKVLGNDISMDVLSGSHKPANVDFLFATMQTMSKDTTLQQFKRDEFAIIVIDEVHRAGAASYQKIMEYFRPQCYLGMTASPDRTDGFDIYALFDHNIAYEIRLQQALEGDMLCPFHYFGITDVQVSAADEVLTMGEKFARLTSEARVEHILEQANYYGFSGDRVKGLIFCSSVEEASALAAKLNERGVKALSLSGSNTIAEREQAIDRLIGENNENRLDYILTRDIFNEGVDIPEINQVIMLRPTESPIVFVQQLGRGLRKARNKEYVVILDFIGNYEDNNFMIPMALSGDRSYNKDNLRRYLLEGSRVIPGASTIHFDKIAQQRIFASIDKTNLGAISYIKENYKQLRNKLGRIPNLNDFDRYGEMDVVCIFNNVSLGSYYNFLIKYEKEYTLILDNLAEKYIKFVSMKFAEGKRPHELVLLAIMLEHDDNLFRRLEQKLKTDYDIDFKLNTKENIINIMTANFQTGTGKKTFADCVFIEPQMDNNDYMIAAKFKKLLLNVEFKQLLQELIVFGLRRYQENYSNPYLDSNFKLYQKYEYEDICRILDWDKNVVPLNIGGYKYDEATKTMPVFINYDKADDVQDSLNYQDRFLNNCQLISLSKNKRTLSSEDVQRFMNAQKLGVTIDLFVRKNKEDNCVKSFYYLGRMENYDGEEITMAKSGESAVEMYWQLDVPVREDIYDYITSGEV